MTTRSGMTGFGNSTLAGDPPKAKDSVKNILRHHYVPGSAPGRGTGRSALIEDLVAHYRRNVRLHQVVVLVALAAMVVAAALAGRHVPVDNKNLALLIGMLMAFFGAVIEIIRRLTREWSQARVMLAVVKTMTEEQLRILLAKMLKLPEL